MFRRPLSPPNWLRRPKCFDTVPHVRRYRHQTPSRNTELAGASVAHRQPGKAAGAPTWASPLLARIVVPVPCPANLIPDHVSGQQWDDLPGNAFNHLLIVAHSRIADWEKSFNIWSHCRHRGRYPSLKCGTEAPARTLEPLHGYARTSMTELLRNSTGKSNGVALSLIHI